MSRSDSKIDLATYKPSREAARLIADEKAAQERLRNANNNPALDAALAEVRGEPAKARPRASRPSPWAKEATPGAEVIDKAVLPSASAPSAPEERALAIVVDEPRPRSWPLWLKVLAALALVSFPALLVYVLFAKPDRSGHDPSAAMSAAASAPTPSTSAGAAPPVASASSVEAASSAEPTDASAPGLAPTSAPSVAVPTLERPRGAPKQPANRDDPYVDAAPGPSLTAVPPAPTASPDTPPAAALKAPEPAPHPSASASAGFQYFRKKD